MSVDHAEQAPKKAIEHNLTLVAGTVEMDVREEPV